MPSIRVLAQVLTASLVALCACSKHHLGARRAAPEAPGAGAREGRLPEDGPPCLVTELTAEVATQSVTSADILFVMDNSVSMSDEQSRLLEHFPRLFEMLTSNADFPALTSLHLGVVSTDMGLLGVPGLEDEGGCSGLGDDGILQHAPRSEDCSPSYPTFLSYEAGIDDPNVAGIDFACIAQLGELGCGWEQPLEAALKALWPASDDRVTFLSGGDRSATQGHGDRENQGFLRTDGRHGPSLIVVVVVSTEDDCSMRDPSFLTPAALLDPSDPEDAKLLTQGLRTRCNANPDHLYPVERYVNALKALRPGNEDLVMFAAFVGVPVETVSGAVLDQFRYEDPVARDQFYRSILDHPRMQVVVEDNGTPDPADDSLRPSCNTVWGIAAPPRRIVEVARGFEQNGFVQSICEDEFGPAVDRLAAFIGHQSGAVCLPRPLERDDRGLVACQLIWELPPASAAREGTPTECEQAGWPFLLPPLAGEDERTARGGRRCRVAQLAVQGDAYRPTEVDGVEHDQGWFYDDFSEYAQRCQTNPRQLISFSPNARPPSGVTVKLVCLDAQRAAASGKDRETASCSAGSHSADGEHVGDACGSAIVPEGGFDPRERYVSTASPGCGDGVCVVDQLDGDPSPECRPSDNTRCASEAEVAHAVYCSCRCDAPDGYAQCACPDGFRCENLLKQGGDDLRGGYCVRD